MPFREAVHQTSMKPVNLYCIHCERTLTSLILTTHCIATARNGQCWTSSILREALFRCFSICFKNSLQKLWKLYRRNRRKWGWRKKMSMGTWWLDWSRSQRQQNVNGTGRCYFLRLDESKPNWVRCGVGMSTRAWHIWKRPRWRGKWGRLCWKPELTRTCNGWRKKMSRMGVSLSRFRP